MASDEAFPRVFAMDATSAPQSEAPSRSHASRRSRLLTGLAVFLGLGLFALGIGARLADVRFNTVVSNSMQPTFSAGDLVITQPVPVSAVRPGEVIAFFPTPVSRVPVIHRVVTFTDGVLTTKGDANGAVDPWRFAPAASATAYRLIFVLPYAGWLSQLAVPLLLLAIVFTALAIVQIVWKEVVRRLVSQPKQVS